VPVPLNRLAYGLLDFFGIKSGEWGPRELLQGLQPTLELGRWYLDQNAQEYRHALADIVAVQPATNLQITSTAPLNISGLVTANELIVPATEAWLLLNADIFWTVPAVAAASVSFGLNVGGSGEAGPFRLPMQLHGFTQGVATLVRSGAAALLDPYWCRPGARIQIACDGADPAASTITASLRLRIMRMTR